MRSRRRVGIAIVAAISCLLAHNLVLLIYNQLTFDRWHRYTLQLPTLTEIAAGSKNIAVRYTTANYYLVRDHIEGATVVLPRGLGFMAWDLARVGRVELEVTEERLEVDDKTAGELMARASASSILRRPGRHKDTDRPIHFIFWGASERYVVAYTRGVRQLILMPESMYRTAVR